MGKMGKELGMGGVLINLDETKAVDRVDHQYLVVGFNQRLDCNNARHLLGGQRERTSIQTVQYHAFGSTRLLLSLVVASRRYSIDSVLYHRFAVEHNSAHFPTVELYKLITFLCHHK